MDKGTFEVVQIGGMTIGRATYEPGWKWSDHVGPARGQGLVPSNTLGWYSPETATAAFEDGTVHELTPGTLFYIPPTPHDSWVVGDRTIRLAPLLGCRALRQVAS